MGASAALNPKNEGLRGQLHQESAAADVNARGDVVHLLRALLRANGDGRVWVFPVYRPQIVLRWRAVVIPRLVASQDVVSLAIRWNFAPQREELLQKEIVAGTPACWELHFENMLPIRAIFGSGTCDARELAEIIKEN